ncbi:MCE family protein [Gordonia sp. ABSL1-1]|uniref:MCE family protein n=1 Tax=Gordonia sp. ABSL1-1 TaxID=3053923 RepID=UPI0025737139|nr:MCE family protein [Gordonia sp. ABSL1-1]MDL9936217.1 MCE family protein [Gordonia sp. ABSL1-1]
MSRHRMLQIGAAALLVVIAVSGAVLGYRHLTKPTRINAVFTSATGIYVGDDVRVAGVAVGKVTAIEPQGETVRMELDVDRGIKIPADARAIIIAQNLVADRFVQLAPAYATSGPVLADGATIPQSRTAVPVEWDEVKKQLGKLATDLGPANGMSESTVGNFVAAGANAMEGNGATLSDALRQLSATGRTLSENSGNISATIRNLQTFVTAVSDSGSQIVQFENRLASLSSVLDGSRSDLDAALTNLSRAVTDVQRFVIANRDKASEQVRRLASVTQVLADQHDDVEQLLHAYPTNMSNFYNIYNPDTGTEQGVFTVNNFSNPIQFICSSVASIENLTAAEGAKRCREYLGPIAPLLSFNYLPVPLNPVLGPTTVDPKHNLIYSEPSLVPSTPAARTARDRRELLLPGQRRSAVAPQSRAPRTRTPHTGAPRSTTKPTPTRPGGPR